MAHSLNQEMSFNPILRRSCFGFEFSFALVGSALGPILTERTKSKVLLHHPLNYLTVAIWRGGVLILIKISGLAREKKQSIVGWVCIASFEDKLLLQHKNSTSPNYPRIYIHPNIPCPSESQNQVESRTPAIVFAEKLIFFQAEHNASW